MRVTVYHNETPRTNLLLYLIHLVVSTGSQFHPDSRRNGKPFGFSNEINYQSFDDIIVKDRVLQFGRAIIVIFLDQIQVAFSHTISRRASRDIVKRLYTMNMIL